MEWWYYYSTATASTLTTILIKTCADFTTLSFALYAACHDAHCNSLPDAIYAFNIKMATFTIILVCDRSVDNFFVSCFMLKYVGAFLYKSVCFCFCHFFSRSNSHIIYSIPFVSFTTTIMMFNVYMVSMQSAYTLNASHRFNIQCTEPLHLMAFSDIGFYLIFVILSDATW